MSEHLSWSMNRAAQHILERVALLPVLAQRVLRARGNTGPLPLAKVLLDGRSQPGAYPPLFRRFLLSRMTDRLGDTGVANTRRELAATARGAGAPILAIQVLLDGDLAPEAVELADREVEPLRRPDRVAHARQILRLLPPHPLPNHPHPLHFAP